MDQKLKRILKQAPNYNLIDGNFDSLALLRAVNALQTLGKAKALEAMRQYIREIRQEDKNARDIKDYDTYECGNLFYVLRCLFEIPQSPGYMPYMAVGGASPPEPMNRKLMPYYPLILVADFPVTVVSGYSLAGHAQAVEEHIDYFQKYGTLRKALLAPPDNPLALLQKIEASPQCLWKKPYQIEGWQNGRSTIITITPQDYRVRQFVQSQLLYAIKPLYPAGFKHFTTWGIEDKQAEAIWQKAVKDVARLPIRWDSAKNDYVLAPPRNRLLL